MFESVKTLIDEHKAVQEELADPAVHADAGAREAVNRRYAELSRIVAAYDAWLRGTDDLEPPRSSRRKTRRSPPRFPRSKSASRSTGEAAASADSA